MSFNFLNNIHMLEAHFIYITWFPSNINMLVIYLFYVTQKTYTCYCSPWHMLSNKSHNMHMFLFLVCSTPGPMSSPDTVSNFSVSQWDHTDSMVGYHNCFSTASSQRDCVLQSTLSHYNLANRCGWRSSSHSSPLSETRHMLSNSLLKNISY